MVCHIPHMSSHFNFTTGYKACNLKFAYNGLNGVVTKMLCE